MGSFGLEEGRGGGTRAPAVRGVVGRFGTGTAQVNVTGLVIVKEQCKSKHTEGDGGGGGLQSRHAIWTCFYQHSKQVKKTGSEANKHVKIKRTQNSNRKQPTCGKK